MRSNWILSALCAVLLVLPATSLATRAQTVESLLERLEKKYDGITGLRASFTQTLESAFDENIHSFSGTLLLAGDKYRYETDGQIYVTDGVTSWVLVASEETLMISNVEDDEGAFSPGDFFSDFDESFEVTLDGTAMLDGDRHHVVKLAPKTADSFVQVATVWMRDRDDLVTQMKYTDFNDTTMSFKMTNIEMNMPIDADAFKMSAPSGYEVIDMRDL